MPAAGSGCWVGQLLAESASAHRTLLPGATPPLRLQGWIYAITKWEPAGKAADALYSVWAKYRMEVTGREPLAVVLEKRRARMAGGEGVAMCRTDDATSMAAADCSSSSSSKEATASSARS